MAPNFQSSFIPKEPVTQEVFKKKKAGFLGVLAISLFFASIIIAGGLFVYKGLIKNEIESLQSQLSESEKNIDKKTIDEMSAFSKKLDVAKALVARHQVISKFMDTLSSSTVSSVQFTKFDYNNLEEGALAVSLEGTATSYASVALQENVFSKNKYFKSMIFSNLDLTDKGTVSFHLVATVDPQVAAYSSN